MTYFLIAGEASGDQHAAALMQRLRTQDPEARFTGLGGDAMRAAGCTLWQDYRKMAFMGFVAVIAHLGDVRRNFRIAQEALLREKPDQLILIDYPSFNLRMAAFCRKHLPATRIIYYIPPKVWAWKKWRVHQIAKLSDDVQCIFPFEPAFYAAYGYDQAHGYSIRYVGNPTMQAVSHYLTEHPQGVREHVILLMPGSRKGEISHCLPRMLQGAQLAIRRLAKMGQTDYRIVIAGAPGIEPDYYQSFAAGQDIRFGQSYELMSHCAAAVVNSGTATLEAALFGIPEVAVYHIPHSKPLKPIWKKIFSIRSFTLPNIIMNKAALSYELEKEEYELRQRATMPEPPVIRELIAYFFTPEAIADELLRLITDNAYRQRLFSDYTTLTNTLLINS